MLQSIEKFSRFTLEHEFDEVEHHQTHVAQEFQATSRVFQNFGSLKSPLKSIKSKKILS